MSCINREPLLQKAKELLRDDAFGGVRIVREIENAPAEDVVEVRHGEWILEKEPDGTPYCFHCSVCDDEFRRIDIKTKTPFCPHCGAKMDG